MDQKARQPGEVLLKDLIEERLDIILHKKSKVYYRENRLYMKKLLDAVGNIPIQDITRQQIHKVLIDYSKDLRKRGKTDHKANAMIRCFKALFNYGISLYELNMKNPVKGIQFFSVDINLKYIPTDEDILAVKEGLTEEQKFLIDFCQQTGCRINEALRLKGSDIGDNYIVLYTRKARNSNLTPRKIPKPPCLAGYKPKKERVFSEWSNVPRFLEKRVKKLDMKYWTWHNLRHKYASELSKRNVPLFEIMNLLGHSNMKTTQIYLQLIGF
ncbi:tyrosine-type recombinase/integrase [Syntrophus aciditrophicus]|nr:site-specific integrase [Syntrophus aciditrophicus]